MGNIGHLSSFFSLYYTIYIYIYMFQEILLIFWLLVISKSTIATPCVNDVLVQKDSFGFKSFQAFFGYLVWRIRQGSRC